MKFWLLSFLFHLRVSVDPRGDGDVPLQFGWHSIFVCLGHLGPGAFSQHVLLIPTCFLGTRRCCSPTATENRPRPTADIPKSLPVQALPVWKECSYKTRSGCEHRKRICLVSHQRLKNKVREMAFFCPVHTQQTAQGREGHPEQALPLCPIQAVAKRFRTRHIKVRSPEQRPFTVRLDKDGRRTYRDVIG